MIKKILHSRRIILAKKVARFFSIQTEVVYFKSGIGDIWKMIATGSIEKQSHTTLVIVIIWLWFGPILMHFELSFLRRVKRSSWPQSDSQSEARPLWAWPPTLGCNKVNVVALYEQGPNPFICSALVGP